MAALCETHEVCLQTLRVKVYSQSREKVVRAIIDTASQRSYVSTKTVQDLGYVSIDRLEVTHSLFGGIRSGRETHNMFKIRVKNLDNSYACNFTAMDQEVICGPIANIKRGAWTEELRANNIILTDVGGGNCPIDILIGADVAGKLLTGRKYNLKNGLTAIETHLGWTVLGKLPTESVRTDTAVTVTTMFVQEANLCDLWRLDAIGITDPIERAAREVREERTREFLAKTARLNADGRYEVRLPWTEDLVPVPSNFEIARNRLGKCLDKLKTKNMLEAYNDVFKGWLAEGIIERVPASEMDNFGHYLYRPVVKEKQHNKIETHSKEDRDYLRFLWIKNGEIIVLRHCRVVFGLACGPFLLAAIIELHLLTFLTDTDENRRSAEKLKQSFYVDNCVTSVDSQEELKTFVSKATTIMRAGGFELRGWENSHDSLTNNTTFVLGILWNKKKDTLSINPRVLELNIPDVVTKRVILSATHKVFDPIGFTCPTSVLPKIILKELWTEKIDWDAKVADSQANRFLNWLKDLPTLNKIEIPRKLGRGDLTLHTFCDASGSAYAAVVFARIERENTVNVRLLSARSRIAPEKATIPRLELMAATIAFRLHKFSDQIFNAKGFKDDVLVRFYYGIGVD
ncbi:PREDICTED: uncharacterized protein LOC105570290 [Vollenhovia emeryi]|uniref:uncharacterized protein LOC105570290 n=1 Tax=Vollenhovia emeryi TaxID=411798 RepID=UPI0005F53C6C|nr:PREDICTED: uncharacterized protein LOC105570290 [Vollenhovia emeryi]